MAKLASKINLKIALFCIIALLPLIWLRGGFKSIYLDLDTARDLHELSNIWIGRIVWVGPELRHGFNITPFYYYLFYPALLIGNGDARALIIFNIVLSLAVLVWLGWLGITKKKPAWLLGVLVIGLSPWWQKISIHPGNGDTYAIFILASLISLSFGKPFWLSSFLMGIAVAFHPTSIFAFPLLLHEWFLRKGQYLKNFIFIIAGFILPWLPNIIFTIITKGYWIRQWLSKPGWQVALTSDVGNNAFNVFQLAKLSGFSVVLALFLWLLTGLMIGKTKEKFWYVMGSLLIILLALISPMPDRYLYGILTITLFVIVLGLVKKSWGGLVLLMLIILLTTNVVKNPPQEEERSIPVQENNIDIFIKKGQIEKEQKIAVLSALRGYKHITPQGGLTPQSNDYRFFLRTKGFKALDVWDYSQAEILVLFIEDPQFDWQEWRSWELDQFGAKKLRFITKVGQTRMIVFDKI